MNNLKILSKIRAYRKDQTGDSDAYYYIDEDQFELSYNSDLEEIYKKKKREIINNDCYMNQVLKQFQMI